VLNLLHFLPDLGALYALHPTPNFYEIHPRKVKMPRARVNTGVQENPFMLKVTKEVINEMLVSSNAK
jgi:hypothetical protein